MITHKHFPKEETQRKSNRNLMHNQRSLVYLLPSLYQSTAPASVGCNVHGSVECNDGVREAPHRKAKILFKTWVSVVGPTMYLQSRRSSHLEFLAKRLSVLVRLPIRRSQSLRKQPYVESGICHFRVQHTNSNAYRKSRYKHPVNKYQVVIMSLGYGVLTKHRPLHDVRCR